MNSRLVLIPAILAMTAALDAPAEALSFIAAHSARLQLLPESDSP
jgi:hypothetical protein